MLFLFCTPGFFLCENSAWTFFYDSIFVIVVEFGEGITTYLFDSSNVAQVNLVLLLVDGENLAILLQASVKPLLLDLRQFCGAQIQA